MDIKGIKLDAINNGGIAWVGTVTAIHNSGSINAPWGVAPHEDIHAVAQLEHALAVEGLELVCDGGDFYAITPEFDLEGWL